MLSPALAMSAKPSRSLAHHWMGLSLGDNLLSIRDRDNNIRVGRRAPNHYLSVMQPLVFISFTVDLHTSH